MAERDGIYFDLPEEEYHADPALGSTDLKNLLKGGPDYWWNSSLNPHHTNQPTPQQERGRALHLLVLEGLQIFRARYVRRPDDLIRLDAKAKAELCPNGEVVLDAEDYDRIRIAGWLLEQNPDLAEAFENGVSEISIFWTESGIRCKARFDYLKIRGIGDLKSIGNYYSRPFHEACANAIAQYRYDIQAAHYMIGRTHIPDLVAAGHVYGDHDRASWLQRVAQEKLFGFQFIFFQIEGAPNFLSWSISPGNTVLAIAEEARKAAMATYRRYMSDFGPNTMWTLNEPVRELDINDLPRWFK